MGGDYSQIFNCIKKTKISFFFTYEIHHKIYQL